MTFGVNDYPYANRLGNDPYGFAAAQCASFANWRCVNDFKIGPQYSPLGLDGKQWGTYLASKGYKVDGTPRVHDIASLKPGVDGAAIYGHVAVVLAVHTDGTVLVEDYNWNGRKTYAQHNIKSAGVQFVHVVAAPVPAPTPSPLPEHSPITLTSFIATVRTDQANVWSNPGGGTLVGHRAEGNKLQIIKWCYSTPVNGDRRWYRINTGGWIAGNRVLGHAPGTTP